jgi:predicted AlkP superfamily pyrophosphatase or phosphodiesterase
MKQRITSWIVSAAAIMFLLSQAAIAQEQHQRIKDLKPTVILISVDGFRADYLEKYPAQNFGMLAGQGVRARWMTPSFPSLTFPNHYAIATGLYTEHNGIVGNNIYDPEFRAMFAISKKEEVQNGRWWLGEPIWVTAEKQGQRAGAFFFPGTEAEIAGKRPSLWKDFDDKLPNFERVDTVLSWLDLPQEKRPTMITMYFSDVDHAGHDFGPDSEVVRQAIAKVDESLGRLVDGLKARGIFDQVNLILVSDHGMARLDARNVVLLDDYFDSGKAEVVVWNGAVTTIFPKPGMEEELYSTLKAKAPAHVTVYRKREVPTRFHYSESPRIGAIVIMADEGWLTTSRGRYRPPETTAGGEVKLQGMHGFDNQLESMRALFVARGPAFKKEAVVEPFANVDVYNVMAKILNLKPARNDGDDATAKAVLR